MSADEQRAGEQQHRRPVYMQVRDHKQFKSRLGIGLLEVARAVSERQVAAVSTGQRNARRPGLEPALLRQDVSSLTN